MQGVIKTLTDKGYGFIKPEGRDNDLFFHSNELQGITFEDLKVGMKVSFEEANSPKGPNATNVTVVTNEDDANEDAE